VRRNINLDARDVMSDVLPVLQRSKGGCHDIEQ
jgi:hypothetical protein